MESLRLRQADYNFVIDCIQSRASCSIIGMSNTGKSMLLRDLAACSQDLPETFVHIDCNLMLAATDQGFYEAVLRALQETLQNRGASTGFLGDLAASYRQTVQPESPFLVPLGFRFIRKPAHYRFQWQQQEASIFWNLRIVVCIAYYAPSI